MTMKHTELLRRHEVWGWVWLLGRVLAWPAQSPGFNLQYLKKVCIKKSQSR